MSTNNVNIVNTNNWYQKMKTNGNQNVTKMVLSGTNPSTQMTLINSANDNHYLYSNYPISSVNGFTMSFQFYISGTASNLTWLNVFFGTLDYNVGSNLTGQGGVQLLINPGQSTYGGQGSGAPLQFLSSVISNTWPAFDNYTAITAGAWQTVSITYNPSGTTGNWVVSYNGTIVMTYDYAANIYGNPIGQNNFCGIGAATGATPATVYIRAVDFSVKQTIPMSVLKNTYSFYPEECFINKLSTHSQNNAAAAFGLRLLKADYLGPIINVRRGSDNATLDFYADSKGNLATILFGNGQTLLSWLAGSIGYVTRWYDQTGNGRDVIQSTTSAQPKIGTPILDKLSTAGKSAARGAYALYRTNSTYTGATIRLRRSADNVTSDFYSDVYGNLTDASGSTFSSWIGSSTAYVNTWYDQSGNNFHATQSTTNLQPVYNGTLKLLDFSNSSFLNMGTASAGPIPTGTLNAPYTFVVKHGATGSVPSNGASIVSGGAGAQNQLNGVLITSNYHNYWYANDITYSRTPVTGNVFVCKYDGTTRTGYINNNYISSAASSGYAVTSGQQYIGKEVRGESTQFTGQLYNVFIFGSSLSDSDRFACTSNPTDLNIKYDGSQCLNGGTTNWPLTNGLKNYTYIFNGRIDGNTNDQAIIQMGQWNASNTGSTLYARSNSYGFAGYNNDALNIVTYSPFVNRKSVMMCNHNLNTGNIVINDNGTVYTGTTGSPSALNLTNAYFTIGGVIHSPTTAAAFIGNINEIIVFRNTLTPKESQNYFTPNAITRKAYRSQPRLQIKDVPKDIGAIPSGAVVALDTQMLLNMSPGSPITSWNGFTGYNSPVLNAATYNSTGLVYDIPPYVSFTNNNGTLSSASTGQYLNAGSKTFNVPGGFTAIWYGAFTGSAGFSERIFDFGNGRPTDNILAFRFGTSTTISFHMYNGSTAYTVTSASGTIVQNEWAVWTFRYTASTRLMEILKNGVSLATSTAAAAITAKTLTNTLIGRSLWEADVYSNINTVGFYAYDRYLSDTQVASVSNHLMYCNSSNMPSALPDSNNKIIRYGSVLSQGYRNGQAMYFSGNVDSYLDIQDIPNWPLTFCFWFRNTSTAATSPATLCSQDGAGNGSNGWGIQVDIFENGTSLAPHYSTNGSTYTPMTPSTVSINTWYHVAFVITPTTVAYYLNGTLIQSVAAVVYNTNRLVIGKSGDNYRPLNGYVQDIRVFDYALRADEINAITNSGGEERALTNYNTPKNYLVNMSNWLSIMNLYKSGSYTIYTAGSGTNVFYQLTSTVADSSNTIFNSTRVQNYNSFTCSFEITIDSPNGDGFYFYCGATSSTTVPTGTAGTAANSSYYFYFKISGTKGIYLFNDQGQQLSYSPVSSTVLTSAASYVPITIVYNRSVKNTWTFNVASRDVLVYDDPNNTNWVSNIAGDFWGIGARTTSNTMYCYIRRLELAYTPFVNSISTNVNAQNNTKFPPGAMTAASTTFTGTSILDGVYTATQSAPGASGGVVAYYAFDNNTSTYAGEIVAYNYNTGNYTGSRSTVVKNLVTNVSTSYFGEWFQIGLPNAVTLNSFGLMGRQDVNLVLERTPTTFCVVGSNDGSTWDLLHSTSGAEFTLAMQYFTCNAGNTNKYSYFRLIANKIGNSGATIRREYVSVGAWDLYTQANLVNANVIAVPPYSMTANTTTFAGNSIYDGTYTLTASSTYTPSNDAYKSFDNTYGSTSNVWGTNAGYNNSTGAYTGSASTTVSGVTQSGEWIQIQLPNPIVLYSFSLNNWWQDSNHWAKSFLIAASNDNSTWTNIYDNTNATFTYGTSQTFIVTGSSIAYKYFRLICRATSGITSCAYWFLDQWKLYTNASNLNLMKFPPAPLTADTPVTFTTVNTNNWYNIGYINNSGGSFVPIISGSDPLTQLQLTDGRVGVGTGFAFANQPVMKYDSFTLTFQLLCSGNGDFMYLSFGGGGYEQAFAFTVYGYGGISFNGIQSPTNWFNNTWNNIRIEYNRGPTNTWTMFFNETQIIQYSDPTWYKTPGSQWGFSTFNGAATFVSYIRQLEMTIAPQTLPGNSIVSGSYIASASSNYTDYMSPSYAFNDSLNNTSISRMWHSAINYSSGPYTGAVTTTVSGTSYAGDWLQLQTPNPLVLRSFSIYPRQDGNLWAIRSPKNFIMAGSNDGSTWYLLHTATGVSDWSSADKYFVCNGGSNVASKYTYFRLVVTSLLSGGDSLQIQNLNLYTPMTLNNSITPATPKGLLDGLTWKYYDGYSSNSVSYYTTNTYRNIGRFTDGTNVGTITSGQYPANFADSYSMEIFGYFRATVSGTYTFYLATDDGNYLWLGSNALIGYTAANANISKGDGGISTVTCTVTLLAGTYYPIRIHYTEINGGNDLQFSFTPPSGTRTYNGQGFFFSGTGVDSAFPQESAKIIKDLTNTNTDGVYYILLNGISTPIHCLMNDCYDGGGWMMLMKGTRGSTFQYSSNYWSTKNTLNASDLTRSDADAKYNTYNYSTVKDVLAIFPDIPSTSYTNVYGQNGGSIFVSDGWTWMVNNWNETTRTTPLTGFNTTRLPHQNSSSAFQTYGINNPFRYNGFGGWCSRQTGSYQHVFYSVGNNANVRWGFLFNNETNDLSSCDVFCGIGMGDLANYSAGDFNNGGAWAPVGINRTARFEMYGR